MRFIDATQDYTEKQKVARQYERLCANRSKEESKNREFRKATTKALKAFAFALVVAVAVVTILIYIL